MPIAIGYMNDDDEPIIHFSDEETRGFPNADAVLAIFIPAAQKCYRLWAPWNTGTDEHTFMARLTDSIDSASQVYLDRQRGRKAELVFIAPHIEAVIPILATAFEKCRRVWTEADYDRAAFVGIVSRYMCIIAFKMYRNG